MIDLDRSWYDLIWFDMIWWLQGISRPFMAFPFCRLHALTALRGSGESVDVWCYFLFVFRGFKMFQGFIDFQVHIMTTCHGYSLWRSLTLKADLAKLYFPGASNLVAANASKNRGTRKAWSTTGQEVVDGCSILANFVWPWVHDLCLKINRSPTKNYSKSHEFSPWVKSSKSAQLWGEDHRVHWGAPVPCFSMFLCQFWSHPSRGGREEDPNARVCLSLSW